MLQLKDTLNQVVSVIPDGVVGDVLGDNGPNRAIQKARGQFRPGDIVLGTEVFCFFPSYPREIICDDDGRWCRQVRRQASDQLDPGFFANIFSHDDQVNFFQGQRFIGGIEVVYP